MILAISGFETHSFMATLPEDSLKITLS